MRKMGKSTDVFEKKQTTRQFERFFCSFGEEHYSCKRVAAVGSLMPQLSCKLSGVCQDPCPIKFQIIKDTILWQSSPVRGHVTLQVE